MSDEPSLEGALVKALDSEPMRNLLSPATKEVGELLGAIASVARFYATDNLENVFVKWSRNRKNSGRTIDAADFKRIMPLLPLASMQSDTEMQDIWAALLESTANNPDTLPSFGQTLSQINADEAKFLVRFLAAVPADTVTIPFTGRFPGEMGYDDALAVYDVRLTRSMDHLNFMFDPYVDDRDQELVARADLVVDDLVRLGIIGVRVDADTSSGDDRYETMIYKWYSLSAYGRKFMQAVTPLA